MTNIAPELEDVLNTDQVIAVYAETTIANNDDKDTPRPSIVAFIDSFESGYVAKIIDLHNTLRAHGAEDSWSSANETSTHAIFLATPSAIHAITKMPEIISMRLATREELEAISASTLGRPLRRPAVSLSAPEVSG